MPIDIEKLVPKDEKYTFLVGAGISMNPPSNLPSARELGHALLELFAPPDDVEPLYNLERLRYEIIVERIQEFFDKNLVFLDYFDFATNPNDIHYFLANAILSGNYVVTTNYDYLIEYALKNLLPDKKNKNILPVITKEDFLTYYNPLELFEQGKFPLYKIHGSKRNIILNKDTKDSLITTISALGKNRAIGQTFAIEPFKKQAVDHLMQDRILVVMGYSGNDDFDIGPVLRELKNVKKLIWIEHQENKNIDIVEFIPTREEIESEKEKVKANYSTHTEILLNEISNSSKINAYLIKSNTMSFLKRVLSTILKEKREIITKSGIIEQLPEFQEWISPKFSEIELVKKFRFSGEIFHDLGEIDLLMKSAEIGLALSEVHNDDNLKSYCYIQLGMGNRFKTNYSKAIEFYNKSLEITKKTGNLHDKQYCNNNLGVAYSKLGENDKALEYYHKAIEIATIREDFQLRALYLCNIATIYLNKSQLDKALEQYNKALRACEESGNIARKTLVLLGIGDIHQIKGDKETALKTYKEALKIAEEVGDLKPESWLYLRFAGFKETEGKYKEALELYKKSLNFAEQTKDKNTIISLKNSIGRIYYLQKNSSKAMEIFQEALKAMGDSGNPKTKETLLQSMGRIYDQRNNYEEALKCFNECLEIDKKIQDETGQAFIKVDIGFVYEKQGKIKEAIELYENAKEILIKTGDFSNVKAIEAIISRSKENLFQSLKNHLKS
ncbi:MAG: tetratricopeptide repeat protein [Promethearchaeota archaeon]